ncbi:hypothetical protein Q2T83_02080 [Fervidibacter sacchari]|uniref:hypothetical protein n=1 Tax=Candidatus Fervidibacter sacchari TaxID=1448929 RepID=UPI0021686175|nr:hypothetical protein [Candidatus Fervidibacter sacchari]WKU16626.1 hypothetical protein Q2T83_02080 [Candidatus Fervidibacter sacchari]
MREKGHGTGRGNLSEFCQSCDAKLRRRWEGLSEISAQQEPRPPIQKLVRVLLESQGKIEAQKAMMRGE